MTDRVVERHRDAEAGEGYIPEVGIRFAAILLVFSITPLVALSSDCASPGGLRVATFNIHYLSQRSDAPVMRWEPRDSAVVTVLNRIDADIVAFQEMETFSGGHYNRENRQLDTIRAAFPEFGFAALGDPENYPSTQPIMYRRDRFAPEEQGFFFFSPNPDEIYSEPWFGRYPAYASWVRFSIGGGDTEQSQQSLLVFNLHIDRERHRDKLRSARLLAERITEIRRDDEEVIVAGDFNAFRFMRPVSIVARDADLTTAPGAGATFHFYRGWRLFPAIDHILYSDGFSATDTRVVRDRPGGIWPSDHFPFVVDLTRQEQSP